MAMKSWGREQHMTVKKHLAIEATGRENAFDRENAIWPWKPHVRPCSPNPALIETRESSCQAFPGYFWHLESVWVWARDVVSFSHAWVVDCRFSQSVASHSSCDVWFPGVKRLDASMIFCWLCLDHWQHEYMLGFSWTKQDHKLSVVSPDRFFLICARHSPRRIRSSMLLQIGSFFSSWSSPSITAECFVFWAHAGRRIANVCETAIWAAQIPRNSCSSMKNLKGKAFRKPLVAVWWYVVVRWS